MGILKGETAKIYLKDNAKSKCLKVRPVTNALRQKIEHELNRMVETGILESVEVSEWETTIVLVKKPDNTVRLCGDYKITVNRQSKLDNYPIPKVDYVFAEIGGLCEIFNT